MKHKNYYNQTYCCFKFKSGIPNKNEHLLKISKKLDVNSCKICYNFIVGYNKVSIL